MASTKLCAENTTVLEVREVDELSQQRLRQHRYKPLAIRLPSLILFLLLFAACITAIERLISRAKPHQQEEVVGSQLLKRSTDLTIGSIAIPYGGVTPSACGQAQACESQLNSLQARWTDLCSEFTATLGASPTTILSPAQQTFFFDWHASYAAVTSTKSAVTSSCYYPTSVIVDNPSSTRTYTRITVVRQMTAGCYVSPFTVEYGCSARADVGLTSGSIGYTISAVCAPASGSLLKIVDATETPVITLRAEPEQSCTAISSREPSHTIKTREPQSSPAITCPPSLDYPASDFNGSITSGLYVVWQETMTIIDRIRDSCCGPVDVPPNCLASPVCDIKRGTSTCKSYSFTCGGSEWSTQSSCPNTAMCIAATTTNSIQIRPQCIIPSTALSCSASLSAFETIHRNELCPSYRSLLLPTGTPLDSMQRASFSAWSDIWNDWRQKMSVLTSECDLQKPSSVYAQNGKLVTEVRSTLGCEDVITNTETAACTFLGDPAQTFDPELVNDTLTYATTGYGASATQVCAPAVVMILKSTPLPEFTPAMLERRETGSPQTSEVTMREGTVATGIWNIHPTAISFNATHTSLSTSQTKSSARSSIVYVVTTRFTTFVRTTNSMGQNTSFSAVAVKNVTLTSSPAATSALLGSPSASFSFAPNPDFKISSTEIELQGGFTGSDYFSALFLAPLLAVIVKGFSEVVVASFKLVEPFHHLSHDEGVKGVHPLSMQYLSSSISLDMFRSLRRGHPITIWSTTMFILLAVVTPLVAASTTVRAKSICWIDEQQFTCEPVWIVNITYLRAVQIILVICATMVLLLIFSTWKYHLRIGSNPASIATVMGLLNHPPLISRLQMIDAAANNKVLENEIGQLRFRLGEYQDVKPVVQRFGFIDLQDSVSTEPAAWNHDVEDISLSTMTSETLPAISSVPLLTTDAPDDQRAWLAMFDRKLAYLWDWANLLSALTLFSLVMAYYFNVREDIFNAFFNSNRAAPKLLLVSLAALVDALIKDLEREIRTTEPYRRLAKRNARPETTILLPLNGTCWSNLPLCLYRLRLRDSHMLWQTLVGIVASLSDFNIIAAAGVPYFDGMTIESYKTCVYIVCCITSMIISTILVTMLWWRRVPVIRDMPREPNTIGAVCSYLCGSTLVKEWSIETKLGLRLEGLDEETRNEVILDAGRMFWFGKMVSVDGKMRCNVDFEREDYDFRNTV